MLVIDKSNIAIACIGALATVIAAYLARSKPPEEKGESVMERIINQNDQLLAENKSLHEEVGRLREEVATLTKRLETTT